MEFPYCGELLLKVLLKNKETIVKRSRLRDSIHRVDEAGVSLRKKRKLKRKVNNVKAPNKLWHTNTNHKLVKWYVIIFGAVDRFSRLPVSLKCVENNMYEILLSCFMKGVQTYGISSQVRLDKGKENVLIADYMIANRRPERGSMICGKSTPKQRIERLWRDVYNGVTGLYHELFSFMEMKKFLTPTMSLI